MCAACRDSLRIRLINFTPPRLRRRHSSAQAGLSVKWDALRLKKWPHEVHKPMATPSRWPKVGTLSGMNSSTPKPMFSRCNAEKARAEQKVTNQFHVIRRRRPGLICWPVDTRQGQESTAFGIEVVVVCFDEQGQIVQIEQLHGNG